MPQNIEIYLGIKKTKLKMCIVMHENSTINRIKCIANEIVRKAIIFLSKVYVRCKV